MESNFREYINIGNGTFCKQMEKQISTTAQPHQYQLFQNFTFIQSSARFFREIDDGNQSICQRMTLCGEPVCFGDSCLKLKILIPLILIFLMMILIIIGNCLVIKIVYLESQSSCVNHRYNVLKVSLAISDLLIGCLVLPIFFYNVFRLAKMDENGDHDQLFQLLYSEKNSVFATTIAIISLTAVSASEYSLMLMALDRFNAINFPISYNNNKQYNGKLLLLIIATWCFVIFIVVYPIIQKGFVNGNFATFMDPLVGVYFPQFTIDSWGHKTYYFVILIFMPYLGMLMFTIISTIQIRLKLRKLKTNEDYRLMRITIVMVVMYSICMLPIIFTWSKRIIKGFDCATVSRWYFISVHFLFINCAVNFIVYSLMSKRFCSALVRQYPNTIAFLPKKVVKRGFNVSRASEAGLSNKIKSYSVASLSKSISTGALSRKAFLTVRSGGGGGGRERRITEKDENEHHNNNDDTLSFRSAVPCSRNQSTEDLRTITNQTQTGRVTPFLTGSHNRLEVLNNVHFQDSASIQFNSIEKSVSTSNHSPFYKKLLRKFSGKMSSRVVRNRMEDSIVSKSP